MAMMMMAKQQQPDAAGADGAGADDGGAADGGCAMRLALLRCAALRGAEGMYDDVDGRPGGRRAWRLGGRRNNK